MEIIRRYHVRTFVTLPVSKNWMALIALLSLLVYVDRAAVAGIWSLWKTSAFSHGFLIVPISLYLVWMRKARLRTIDSAPTFWALPVLILVEFVWLLARLSLTAVVEQFCFVTTGIVIVWGLFGTEVIRTIRLPLAFLFFAVPFGEIFIPQLQDFCAWFAMQMLDLAGIPVLREGRFIFVPFGKWEVAEACSGIRYLTASLA